MRDRIQIGPSASDGRVEGEVRGYDLDSLACEIAGFGASAHDGGARTRRQ
jgi:hypothetical protein